MRQFFILFILLFLPFLSHTQTSSWVSVSNEFITISMDKTTGRYIVYDNINYQAPSALQKDFFPREFLQPTSPPPFDSTLSPILGSGTNAYNVTALQVDGTPVIFGSSSGQWNSQPITNATSIIYSWTLGELDIVQTLEIITNSETLFPESVQVSYDVFNNNSTRSRDIETKIVLDPIANDGLNHTFYLPNNQAILTEYVSTLGVLPRYWVASDSTGQISPLSLKGYFSELTDLKPRLFYLTTMDRALEDIWQFTYSRNNVLSGRDSAVVLFYPNKTINPSSSRRVATTIVSVPSLINNFNNNGLEARTSTFVNQQTTPTFINLWIQNTNNVIFDAVDLEIRLPEGLVTYDSPIKTIVDVGSGNVYPVSWNVGTDSQISNDYSLSVNIRGYRNGVLESQFDVPIVLNIDPNYIENNTEILNSVISTIQTNISAVTQTNTQNNVTLLSPFNSTDVLGSTSESLARIQLQLQTNNTENNLQIINLIETELQLIQEIKEVEKGISDVNTQYEILLGVYQRLYSDKQQIERDQISVQGLIDNLNNLNKDTVEQTKTISNLIYNLSNTNQ